MLQVKFIAGYFTLFDAVINGIVFFLFLLVLVYRNVRLLYVDFVSCSFTVTMCGYNIYIY